MAEVLSEHAEDSGGGVDLKRAAATAITAALAGALVGAAKSVADKRGQRADDEPTPEPEDDAGVAEETDDDAGEPEEDDEPATEPEHEDAAEQTGASSSDVASIIARAKEHVEAVIGSEAESVSGVERANGSWRVNVEVVQMRRIPESTDILASYGVALDGDGDLISVQELRRYRRSQADDDR